MNFSVCIQAAGQSRRMGKNKAFMLFSGQPLIERVIERLRAVGDELVIISNNQAGFEYLNLPVTGDQIPGGGVLSGLHAALTVARYPFVAVVACDMPFVNPVLLQAEFNLIMDAGADVVVPETANGFEPLHAIYRRDTCLPVVQEALSLEQRRLISWFERVNVRIMTLEEVAVFDPNQTAFFNINTPEDLVQAEVIARSTRA
jgi:molybdopterin-guanine dinucleotide biosynthesis protein A